MTTIAILGAAGNMGTRACNALKDDPEYSVFFVEAGEAGGQKLRERGLAPAPMAQALAEADVVLLTIPDALIGKVAAQVVPQVKSGAMVIGLDPAAPHAGRMPERDDVTYFFTHPAHPPIFNDEEGMEARRDFFGSGLAVNSIFSSSALTSSGLTNPRTRIASITNRLISVSSAPNHFNSLRNLNVK